MCWLKRRKGGQYVMGPQQPRPEVQREIPKAPPRNPTVDLWSKRNTSSGHFERIKKEGKPFKGVKREN